MATRDELDEAVKRVNALSSAPGTSDMLALYGLYKQATAGDVTGSRPGIFDVKGRAKWDAWSEKKGTSKEAAADQYLALARRLGA
jgi:diazepam-binding inhibitor (GABA receptor modulator, acyl-CoA-binding protein)